ncbi:signal transduction histidine kinase, nitrogen specific, NtrB [Caldithrix abyssi DSM 13497]|uniref:histidine kinase n=1 Tax=Caldithrix abyssi DSM 13497 TaxID=880073 RepID=H1XQX6_CALAY|nr:ATP-binding protein [Caldithrix abyssi]APF19982.1 PAS domain S-box-containing protein [Caldithrix abyssi DSM 13497]EHO40070.1 signal transduction histidine kinase, nitrogen specific, NtrB [Caldithrix abyssi DSM 13497]
MKKNKKDSIALQTNSFFPLLQDTQKRWIGVSFLLVVYLAFNHFLFFNQKGWLWLLGEWEFWLPVGMWLVSILALSYKALIRHADTFLFLFYLSVGTVFLVLFHSQPGLNSEVFNFGFVSILLVGYFFLLPGFWWALAGGLILSTLYSLFPIIWPQNATMLQSVHIIFILFANLFGIVFKILDTNLLSYLKQQREEIKTLSDESLRLHDLKVEFEQLKEEKEQLFNKNQSLQEKIIDLNNIFQLEQSLTTLATQFIQATIDEIDSMVNNGLKTLCEYFEADRSYLYFFAQKGTSLKKSHEYRKEGVKEKIARHEQIDKEDFKWFVKALRRSSHLAISDVDQLPVEASTIKSIWKVEDIRSLFIVPLILNESIVGFIGLDFLRKREDWPSFTEHTLLTAGLIFLNALERKRYKEHLRRSESRIKMLFERSADVIFVATPSGRILDMNPAGVKLFGFKSLNDVLKVKAGDLYLNPEDHVKFMKAIEKKGFVKDYELTLKNRDGQKILVLVTAGAVKNEAGKIVAYEGIMRDVTEKKQLEQQLFQAQKMESIGLLTGSIAHDFNNILTAINGYAEMIRRGLPDDHEMQAFIQNILRSGRRAENLIRQLLAFSRKQLIEPRVVNLNQIIDDLKKMLRQLINEDIELVTQLAEDVPPIKADPGQIEQMLVNLIINSRDALNHLSDPGVRKMIKVQTEKVVLDEDFVSRHAGSREGEYVRISISDNGIGIPEEIQDKIFEPFFTTKSEGKGTGLGLSTVYGIIKQNGGSIYLESAPGQGTTFHIYWPVSEEEQDKSERDETSEISTKAQESIMVVEDDPDVRELACTFLKNLGYKVYAAENGARALEIIKQNNLVNELDMVFSDMVMPVMGGDQLAEEIKELNPNIKILLTSGYTDSQLMKTGLLSRGYRFLHKPYTIQQMAKKVRAILDNKE